MLVSHHLYTDQCCARMMHPPTPLPGGLLLDHELRELTHEKERVRRKQMYDFRIPLTLYMYV